MTEKNYTKTILTSEDRQSLLATLKKRFEKHIERHESISWDSVIDRLENNDKALKTLQNMEMTNGEPDVVGSDKTTGELIFFDCSKESPKGRRKLCYDDAALESRKKFPPDASAVKTAEDIGIELLNENQYRYLQKLGEFDTKTSSWVNTPDDIRRMGGALFCDRRYNAVFIYHNGAESYYSSRGFRGCLKV